MHDRHGGVIVLLAALVILAAMAGCGTCVSVEATYEDLWQATRDAIRAQPDMGPVNPLERYDEGTIEAVVVRRAVGDELHYRAEIKPVGGEDSVKRNVCVWVQEVNALVVDGGTAGPLGQMQAQRRRDLEEEVTRLIEREFGASDEPATK